MLYMVEKTFLYGISFNIAYNESGHENRKNVKYLFFHSIQKKISVFLKQRDGGTWKSTVLSYTHISIK